MTLDRDIAVIVARTKYADALRGVPRRRRRLRWWAEEGQDQIAPDDEELFSRFSNPEERARHVAIFEGRLLGEKPAKTLKAVGEELGLGRERVRQIEAVLLRRLRHPELREQTYRLIDEHGLNEMAVYGSTGRPQKVEVA